MLRILLTIALCVLGLPALAQDYNKSLQIITEMNRIQAPQNPNYERSEKILTRRVTDRKSQVIGVVEDVIFRGNGGIQSLKVEFDRLRLSQPVYINFHEMNVRHAGRAYQLGFESDQIASIYPELLANIETAGGEGGDEFSLKRTLGAPVNATGGGGIGTISDVLFSADGDRVEAIYVRMSQGALNGRQVAVPVDSVNLSDTGQRVVATASPELAKAMADFAARK